MDGHGVFGHEVSAFVKKNLPIFIENSFPYSISSFPDTSPNAIQNTKKAILAGFANTCKYLVSKRVIDINYSGTTAVTVLIRDKFCICANVGDSRAIIGRFSETWHPIALSTDHKPDLQAEKSRIEKSGGRVEPFKEENGEFVGPYRVWLRDEQLPGLAMSRSIGDLVAAHVGVSFEPEIITHELTAADKFLVVATDGVWEFISNQECVKIVSECYEKSDIELAADRLLEKACNMWKGNDNDIDDITLMLVFFEVSY